MVVGVLLGVLAVTQVVVGIEAMLGSHLAVPADGEFPAPTRLALRRSFWLALRLGLGSLRAVHTARSTAHSVHITNIWG